ncbi:MAG: hypothetical protein RLZZ419_784 [Pseudomonadota bacterium]
MSGFKQTVAMAWLVAATLVNIGVCAAGSVAVVGESGPYGGIIYYVDSSGEHGLEAKAADETKLLSWSEAVIAASAYGNGWHLPTKTELKLLYEHKNSVGAFAKDDYWSLTELDSNSAWIQGFGNADQDRYNKHSRLSVRAVRAF